MKNIEALFIVLLVITACSSSSQEENLKVKKVGNYPKITQLKEKMLLSKDDKYLFVVNNSIPNQIDILDVRDLTKPKFFKKIMISNKKDNFIVECKLSKDKKYLYAANYVDRKILIYDIQKINAIKKIKEIPIQSLTSFVLNGKYLGSSKI